MFCDGMKCPLCDEPMYETQDLFGTWGVWLPSGNPLLKFCDASMHWSCYAAWPHRPEFARSYVDFWVRNHTVQSPWRIAHLDRICLVSVNPDPTVWSSWIYFYATGSRKDVSLDLWSEWLARGAEFAAHQVEREAIEAAVGQLRLHHPTRKSLLAACIRTD